MLHCLSGVWLILSSVSLHNAFMFVLLENSGRILPRILTKGEPTLLLGSSFVIEIGKMLPIASA
jgi:RsiW-degrading membrane proteinase PrsW (M82 family)